MKIIAVLPTYNESGNIKKVVREILSLNLDIEALVVDDFSPDGTYKLVEEMQKENPKVHLLLRKENRGRGWAGIEGFKKALELGADLIVEMDADLSHSPKFIPDFVKAVENADIVVGSRYVAGGKDESRAFLRKIISTFARKYLSFVLGVRLNDPTSGFRMFKREVLEAIIPKLSARDPFIVSEVVYFSQLNGFKFVEVPIEFYEREAGESKLKPATLFKYLYRAILLCFRSFK